VNRVTISCFLLAFFFISFHLQPIVPHWLGKVEREEMDETCFECVYISMTIDGFHRKGTSPKSVVSLQSCLGAIRITYEG
jgi:hypothetical protein